jgi:hypothetical protein
LAYGTFEHKVHPLAGTLYEAAFCHGLRQTPVAWVLLIKNILRCDSGRETTRTHYLKTMHELADKDRSPKPVIAMGQGVQ